jgi:hypothetical protein
MVLFWLTATSVVAYSILALVYKAASPHVRPNQMIFAATVVCTFLSLVYFGFKGGGGSWVGSVMGVVAGLSFYIASVYRAKAVQTSPVSLVFAISNLDLVLAGAVVLFIPAFGSQPTLWNVLACAVAGLAVLIGGLVRGGERISGYTYASLGLLVVSTLTAALYARSFPQQLAFLMVLDYAAGAVPNLHLTRTVQKLEWRWGLVAGLLTFAGFWVGIEAQARASSIDLPLVLLALSLKTPLTALLAVPIFKERITLQKVAAVSLATLALVLWQI